VPAANAGIAKYVALGEITEEHFDSIFSINVNGALFTFRRCMHYLRMACRSF